MTLNAHRTRLFALPLGLVLLAAACTPTVLESGIVESGTRVSIARDAWLELLPPASFGRALALEQVVTARHGAESHRLHAQVEIDRDRLVMVGLSPFGTRAYVLAFDGTAVTYEQELAQKLPFDPRHMLADLQLALWPGLPTLTGLTVSEERNRRGFRVRRLRRGSTPVLQIAYERAVPWEGRMRITHLERGYTLDVETLEAVPLDDSPHAEPVSGGGMMPDDR